MRRLLNLADYVRGQAPRWSSGTVDPNVHLLWVSASWFSLTFTNSFHRSPHPVIHFAMGQWIHCSVCDVSTVVQSKGPQMRTPVCQSNHTLICNNSILMSMLSYEVVVILIIRTWMVFSRSHFWKHGSNFSFIYVIFLSRFIFHFEQVWFLSVSMKYTNLHSMIKYIPMSIYVISPHAFMNRETQSLKNVMLRDRGGEHPWILCLKTSLNLKM